MARTWYQRGCSESDPDSDDSSAEAELGASSLQGQLDLNPALRVIKVVCHPSNEVKNDRQKEVERPSQLFWEKKQSGRKELVRILDPA